MRPIARGHGSLVDPRDFDLFRSSAIFFPPPLLSTQRRRQQQKKLTREVSVLCALYLGFPSTFCLLRTFLPGFNGISYYSTTVKFDFHTYSQLFCHFCHCAPRLIGSSSATLFSDLAPLCNRRPNIGGGIKMCFSSGRIQLGGMARG